MPGTFTEWVDAAGKAVDVAGVLAISLGIVLVAVLAVRRAVRRESDVYTGFRQQLGRVILLGLELLVAADIIRTVAVTPTLESVVVLGVIVLVRTFLSFSLEVELNGAWPWQRGADRGQDTAATWPFAAEAPRLAGPGRRARPGPPGSREHLRVGASRDGPLGRLGLQGWPVGRR